MKHLGILFLSLSASFAQQPVGDFITDQGARITIGQPTFTAEASGHPSAYQLGAAHGVAYANNTLFVVDSNHLQIPPVNNRVLIFANIARYIHNPTDEVPQGSRCPVCVGDPSVGQASLVLGQPDFTTTANPYTTQRGFRNPTGVASDGHILVISDTDNNRVLIWKTLPTTIDQPADLVLGQKDFTSVQSPPPLNSSSFRAPEGVWIQGTRLFVADTQNHRVMVWNNIPTSMNQSADYVLGEPNFTTSPPSTTSTLPATASNLFSPVSVTSDGQHLFVSDLGHHRVLIWNSIPTQNGQAADVEVGQPDMTSGADNNSLGSCVTNGNDSVGYPTYPPGCKNFCPSNGTEDADNTIIYPTRCGYTLSYPRFALSDGRRLFIADSGNDRVLIYNTIPTTNGAKADIYLGQVDEYNDQLTNSTSTYRPDANIMESAPQTVRTPLALAWDGTNLYVSDPYDLRVLVFTPALPNIQSNGIANGASLNTYAIGTISFSGTITASNTITVTIKSSSTATGISYTYTVVSGDTLATITQNLANLINGTTAGTTPDPNVIASANTSGAIYVLDLVARTAGLNGNNVAYSATTAANATSGTATETVTAAGSTLSGGAAAAEIAPGTMVSIFGNNLADTTAVAAPDARGNYPTTLSGVQVYFDGIRSPVLYVSPGQINTQMPFEVSDSSGVSAYVRTVHSDGSITTTNAIGVPVVGENPGIFAQSGSEPRVAIAYHTGGNAVALVDIGGSVTGGDIATITVGGNPYNYTVETTDTLEAVRDGLITLINGNSNEKVIASAAGGTNRIILTAKAAGPAGNGIVITGGVTTSSSTTSATVSVSVVGSAATCCANIAGSRVTPDNPAVPSEVITIYATGIGPTTLVDGLTLVNVTGQVYPGPALNIPVTAVDNAQVGGSTANVLRAGLAVGMLPGIYEVQLQLSNSIGSNPLAQMYIAQSVFTSNIVTIPVVANVRPSARPSLQNSR